LDLEVSEEEPNNEEAAIIIIRLFETSGYPQKNVEIEFENLFRIKKAIETDLLERKLSEKVENSIKIMDNRKLTVNFNKFEIKTLKLWITL